MTNAERLVSLVDRVPAEARPSVARLLRQVAHDLNTPVSTLTMEAFSALALLGRLRPSTGDGQRPDNAQVLLDLEDIFTNLEHVVAKLTEYVLTLSVLVPADSADAARDPEAPAGDDSPGATPP